MTLYCISTHLRRGIKSVHYTFIQAQCNSTTSTAAKENWDLVSAVCLERKPVVTTELNQTEKNFSQLLSRIEFENSLRSDHELRHRRDLEQAELLKKGEETDVEQALKQTAQDFEDACQDELNRFQFSPRVTQADESNDVRSLNRKLDRSLLLLIEQKLGDRYTWALPQGKRGDGETMRQAAERVLKENCGDNLRARFIGNAPCGFYKYKYPKEMRSDAIGAKVFFFKAFHVEGQVAENENRLKDYKWLGRNELTGLPKEYHKSVTQFLIDEN